MLLLQHSTTEIEYTGHQLSPHWIYRTFDLQGDALVSFIGPCRVALTEMVDLADVKAQDFIYSPRMLHFIAEFFDDDLPRMIFRQRLFIVTLKEELEDRLFNAESVREQAQGASKNTGSSGVLRRNGDDLFLHRPDGSKGKLSVSIATRSIVSSLMHTGVNIETEGTPVPTAGLKEMGIDPADFAEKVKVRFAQELESIRLAQCKVRGV